MNNAIKLLETVTYNINGLVWSPFMLVLFLGTGLYFSARTGFIQIFKLKQIISETIIRSFKRNPNKADKGSITPFQALSTALAGTIGTGNIAGVATAITIAGPGAVFWMWVSAFFGMMTKYAEIVLAIKYRRKNSRGEWIGGPMLYIGEALNMKWLAAAYSFLGIAASFGVGNMAQANSISSALKDAFNIPPIYTGVAISVIVGLTIVGGIKSIASVTEKVIPIMSVLYILSALSVIFFNFGNIPNAAMLILSSAFNPIAPIGGFMGAGVATAIQKGISRGIFTNESGLGSASIAHSAANTDHPSKQGLWGIFEVFFDTIVMCTITAFAILVTGVWTNGLTGSSLTICAFETVLHGIGKYVIAISLAVFAFSSILAWSFYGKKCIEYIFKDRFYNCYLIAFLLTIILGSVAELNIVWEISDALNGLMAVPNIIGLICLSGVVISTTHEGLKRMKL